MLWLATTLRVLIFLISWTGQRPLRLSVFLFLEGWKVGPFFINLIYFILMAMFLGVKAEVKSTHFSSKAFGQRDSKDTALDGRLQLDLLQFMQREHKLRSYSLNSVCAQFLGEQKEDVHHSVISELQNGTPESRRRLAVYCLKVRF